jgi:hypothetical protein
VVLPHLPGIRHRKNQCAEQSGYKIYGSDRSGEGEKGPGI